MNRDKELALRALIATALPVEYEAVRAYLSNIEESIHPEGTYYEVGEFRTGAVVWQVGLVEAGKGGVNAALETERALRYFQPHVQLFVGVAGGLKDVHMGDVVAATKVYAYESGKIDPAFEARPDIGHSTYRMVQHAQAVARQRTWCEGSGHLSSPYQPQAFVAPMVAGEKVLTSARSRLYAFLKSHFNDALAIEMEAHGFLAAAHANQQVEALVVRGISDLLDNKQVADAVHSQDSASQHASAFAFAVLSSLAMDRSFCNVASTTQEQSRRSEIQVPAKKIYNTQINAPTTLVQGDNAHIVIRHTHAQAEEK